MGTGTGAVGGSGTGGTAGTSCYANTVPTTCTDGVAPPRFDGLPETCAVEGARCQGYRCHDDRSGYSWTNVCCSGLWRDASACPAPVHPGDPFACGGVTCVGGESYCSHANESRTDDLSYSCRPLCAAGDCSCFCDNPEGCSFAPPGSTCPADTCQCGLATTAEVVPIPGSVGVTCSLLPASALGCFPDPSHDGQCDSASKAWLCSGPEGPSGFCAQLPDSVITAPCGTTLHEYCCPF